MSRNWEMMSFFIVFLYFRTFIKVVIRKHYHCIQECISIHIELVFTFPNEYLLYLSL